MIPKEIIEKIFDTARIDEVVGEYVTLKKRGANLLGHCPFHNEKSPSFTVSPAKGIYKCFGCGKAGNSVNFIMDHDQLSYPEALRHLARKYQIDIPEVEQTDDQRKEENEREALFVVCSYAQKQFTNTLWESDEGRSIGLGYFKERGFSEDIIRKFQLGFAFEKWGAFSEKALSDGYTKENLVKAGLSIIKEDNGQIFDRFGGRVIFPVHNVSGRVYAFGGRTLKTDKKIAKYINSPETPIYHKSKSLYGIFFSKKEIIAQDNCFLVEGYTDVISLHQAGIENVVASSGTSLTVDQIRIIRRYTNNITILYDGDFAGIKASFRGIDLILEEGMNVKVLLFPDGEDPDSYSRKVGGLELKEFIKGNSKDFITFKTQLLSEDAKGDPIKKAGLIKDIIESVSLIPDIITRSVYLKECSRLLDVEETVLISELNKLRRKKITEKKDPLPDALPEEFPPIMDEFFDPEAELEPKTEPLSQAESHEKEIIRLLVNYGDSPMKTTGVDEEEKEIEIEVPVAIMITHDLSQDGVIPETPAYEKIFKIFNEHAENNIALNYQYFVTHHDPEISSTVINLVSFPYLLSNWEEYGIPVTREDANLTRTVNNAIIALKIRKIEMLILEKQKRLKENLSDAELEEVMKEQKNLIEAKKTFSALLGRIILK